METSIYGSASYIQKAGTDLSADGSSILLSDIQLPDTTVTLDETESLPMAYFGSLNETSFALHGPRFDEKAETVAGVTHKTTDIDGNDVFVSHGKHFEANTGRRSIQSWLANLMTKFTISLHGMDRFYGGMFEEEASTSPHVAWVAQQRRGRVISMAEARGIAFGMSEIAERELAQEREAEGIFLRSFLE